MSTKTEQVFVEALALPTRQRAASVHKLLTSLESKEETSEIEAAWKEEALARCQAFDEGNLTDRDAAGVLREAYKKVK